MAPRESDNSFLGRRDKKRILDVRGSVEGRLDVMRIREMHSEKLSW